MILILIAVIGMVAWSLHLMQQAFEAQEFSLMLAGCLVAAAAAAMMVVYFLMGDYVVYMTQMSHTPDAADALLSSGYWTPVDF